MTGINNAGPAVPLVRGGRRRKLCFVRLKLVICPFPLLLSSPSLWDGVQCSSERRDPQRGVRLIRRGRCRSPHPPHAPGVTAGLGASAALSTQPSTPPAPWLLLSPEAQGASVPAMHAAAIVCNATHAPTWGQDGRGGSAQQTRLPWGCSRSRGGPQHPAAFAAVRVGNLQPEEGRGDFSPSRLSSPSLFPLHQLPSLPCSFRSAAFCALLGH